MAKQRIFEPRISRRTTNSTGNENLRRNRPSPPRQGRGRAMVSGSASAPGRTTPRPRGVTQKKCGRRPVESSTCRARGAPDGTRGRARSPGPLETAMAMRRISPCCGRAIRSDWLPFTIWFRPARIPLCQSWCRHGSGGCRHSKSNSDLWARRPHSPRIGSGSAGENYRRFYSCSFGNSWFRFVTLGQASGTGSFTFPTDQEV